MQWDPLRNTLMAILGIHLVKRKMWKTLWILLGISVFSVVIGIMLL